MAKKTYKEKNGTTRVGDFLRDIGKPETLGKILNVAGDIATGNWGGAIKAITSSVELSESEKTLALKAIEADISEQQEVTKRWEADSKSDSWMAKNIRPLTLAFLTLSLAIYIVLDSSIVGFTVKSEWISLLSSLLLLVYGAYFGMRGLEKIQKIRSK